MSVRVVLAILLVSVMVGCSPYPDFTDNQNSQIETPEPDRIILNETSEKNVVSGKVIPYQDAVIAIIYEEMFYKVILENDSETEILLSDKRPIFSMTRVDDTLNVIIADDMIEGSEYLDKNYISFDLITKDAVTRTLTLPVEMVANDFFWLEDEVFVWCIATDGYSMGKSEIFELNYENKATKSIASNINYAYAGGSVLYFSGYDAPYDIFAYDVRTHEIEEYYTVTSSDQLIYAWIVTEDYIYIETDSKIVRINPHTAEEETLIEKDSLSFDAYRSYLTNCFNNNCFYYHDNDSLNVLDFESKTTTLLLSGRFEGLFLLGNKLYYYEITDENAVLGKLRSIAVN
jgi:hypothetical protein